MKKLLVIFAAAASLLTLSCSKKNQVVINGIKDLPGKTIGVQAGTTGELYVQDELKTTPKPFKTGIDAALALNNGSIDAIVIDELPAKEIVKRNDSLKIVEDDFYTEEYAIAVKKGNTELLNSINSTIDTLKADGTYEKLINDFMPADGNIKINPVELLSGKPELKMGTNAAFPPFEYINGTEAAGFDISMCRYIAKNCNKTLKVVDMNFDSLIAALQSNAVDMVAAGMTATEERRKNVDFSNSYYSSKQVIIIRK